MNFKRNVIKETIKYFLLMSILVFLILYGSYRIEYNNRVKIIKNEQKTELDFLKENIYKELDQITSDIYIISKLSELEGQFDINADNLKSKIKKALVIYSDGRKKYDQFRIIGKSGMEFIRINLENKKSEVVPEDELQFKGHRYYFKESMKLSVGDLYMSPFDLNIENKRIEKPEKPMIRIGTKIELKDGIKFIFLANYLGDNILDLLDQEYNTPVDPELLNKDGYWIYNKDKSMTWGFMYDDREDEIFKNYYSEEWKKVKNSDNSPFKTSNGIFSNRIIYPNNYIKERISKLNINLRPDFLKTDNNWNLILKTSNKKLNEIKYGIVEGRLIIAIILFPFILGIAIVIGVVKTQNEKLRDELEKNAITDELTGIYNRRMGLEILQNQLNVAKRNDHNLVVCFIDVNGLKKINDNYGHSEGDKLIMETGKIIEDTIRESDTLSRMGGDEFIIILPECSVLEAEQVIGRLQSNIEGENKRSENKFDISISYGLAHYFEDKTSDIDELIERADSRMYEYKQKFKMNRENM